jgi:putative transposase
MEKKNMKREISLSNGEVYHIVTRSISDYKIFNNKEELARMINCICYYQIENPSIRFSRFIEFEPDIRERIRDNPASKDKLVDIIAFCIMPTHVHLVLKQIKQSGISIFMGNILNSYSRYFNIKHGRKGPLWEGRFKNIIVDSDEQLLHLTRYVHLNPVTAYLVNKPEDWAASSYREYIQSKYENPICNYSGILEIEAVSYAAFVENRISYQRELAKIKSLILD